MNIHEGRYVHDSRMPQSQTLRGLDEISWDNETAQMIQSRGTKTEILPTNNTIQYWAFVARHSTVL